jgi:hypothetical protein
MYFRNIILTFCFIASVQVPACKNEEEPLVKEETERKQRALNNNFQVI